MVVAYVIIPGIGGSGEEHWQTLWERQWGAAAVRITPQSWSQPDLLDWVAAVDRAVNDAEARDSEVVLIAHSLGCWAASAWLNGATGRHLAGALLVAPPDQTGDAFPVEAASTFVGVEARMLPCRSVVVASTNDPYCSLDVAERLATSWGSLLHVVGEFGHLNTASSLGNWPLGREVLEMMVSEPTRSARHR
jgi:predicted alpha/beta hydrolase family esterase